MGVGVVKGMKKLWMLGACLLGWPLWTTAQNLEVQINGLGDIEGNLRVAVFDAAKEFPDDAFALQKKEVPVYSRSQVIAFDELPEGRYAVAVYHDADRNGELNKNFFGMPTEDYGFSNDATGSFGPPSFGACMFYYNGKARKVVVNID